MRGMDSQKKSLLLERNPKTHAEHKREVFWQITVPLVVGLLVILAAVGAIIFSAVQPVTDVGRWAGVSLIWLIIPSLFFAFILLVLLAGLIYAITYLLRLVPHYALIIQMFIEQTKNKVGQLLNLPTEPILRINSIWAAIRYATERGRKSSRGQS